jgi:hypothetical protein
VTIAAANSNGSSHGNDLASDGSPMPAATPVINAIDGMSAAGTTWDALQTSARRS